MIRDLPSPELLRKLLRYEPDTGKLFWRHRTPDMFNDGYRKAEGNCANWNSKWAGKEALNYVMNDGYKFGGVLGVKYLAHRIIFTMYYGEQPKHQIDHIDGNRKNNKISNLRDVPPIENSKNQAKRKSNTSGHCGVKWQKNCWVASIGAKGKKVHLGCFQNINDAIDAREKANIKYGYSDRHGS